MAEADSISEKFSSDFLDHVKAVVENSTKNTCDLPLCVRKAVPDVSIDGWIANQSDAKKVYWQNRAGSVEIGGVGEGLTFSPDELKSLMRLGDDINLTAIFVRSFNPDEEQDKNWQGYPRQICFIPRMFLRRLDNDYFIEHCLVVHPGDTLDTILEQVQKLSSNVDDEDVRQPVQFILRLKRHMPGHDGWARNIKAATDAIAGGGLQKIVLSRRSDFELDRAVDPFALFRTVTELHPGTYQFYYQPKANSAFMSVTPERLFYRNDKSVSLEAVAATEKRGADAEEDILIEQRLLSDNKQLQEHNIVVEYITEHLAPLCEGNVQVQNPLIFKLAEVQHLRTQMSATLKAVDDISLINNLHPTPAVGGLPKEKALAVIEDLESHCRGWYAGAIGVISREATEIAVGIRSLVMRDRELSVFTGAGIISASDAEREWDEIDSKNILNGLLNTREITR